MLEEVENISTENLEEINDENIDEFWNENELLLAEVGVMMGQMSRMMMRREIVKD